MNALSLYLDVTVNKHGHLHNVRFEKGILVKPLRDEGPTPDSVTWATSVSFHPDPSIFKEFDNQFNYDRIRNRLRELAYLTGLKIVIRDERVDLHAGQIRKKPSTRRAASPTSPAPWSPTTPNSCTTSPSS